MLWLALQPLPEGTPSEDDDGVPPPAERPVPVATAAVNATVLMLV